MLKWLVDVFADKTFLGLAFSSLFGALFGALAASRLGRLTARTERIAREITACNVGFGLCFSIANALLSQKSQSIKPLTEDYERQRQVFGAIVLGRWLGYQYPQVSMRFDLMEVMPIWTAIASLTKVVSESVNSASGPSIILAALTQAIENQRHARDARSELIAEFRQIPAAQQSLKQALYFGVQLPNNASDERYPNSMQMLKLYTNDVIYFSLLLGELLEHHAVTLTLQLGGRPPRVTHPDFSRTPTGLIPDRQSFVSFERDFKPRWNVLFVTM
jgi:hypothetical protein